MKNTKKKHQEKYFRYQKNFFPKKQREFSDPSVKIPYREFSDASVSPNCRKKRHSMVCVGKLSRIQYVLNRFCALKQELAECGTLGPVLKYINHREGRGWNGT